MAIRNLFSAVKETFTEFLDDDCMTLAGALAYYTALSFAPLMVLVLSVGAALGYGDEIIEQVKNLMGGDAVGDITDEVTRDSKDPFGELTSVSGVISLLALFFSASGVFAQLQASLNRVWDVKAAPSAGWLDWVRKRLLSLGMVLTIAFLLLISLVITGLITGLTGSGTDDPSVLWQAVNFVVSVALLTLLFALMFKVLPDVLIDWRHVWIGAAVTAVLFTIGKTLIGMYIAMSGTGSAYGAAGSLIALLVWVFYSAVILFLGAEATQVYTRRTGGHIRPDQHAVWIDPPPEMVASESAGKREQGTGNREQEGGAESVSDDRKVEVIEPIDLAQSSAPEPERIVIEPEREG